MSWLNHIAVDLYMNIYLLWKYLGFQSRKIKTHFLCYKEDTREFPAVDSLHGAHQAERDMFPRAPKRPGDLWPSQWDPNSQKLPQWEIHT